MTRMRYREQFEDESGGEHKTINFMREQYKYAATPASLQPPGQEALSF